LIINHYFQRKIDGPVYLKVDIEGGEYPYFLTADIDIIADLTIGLSIEVHWLEKDKDRDDFIKIKVVTNIKLIVLFVILLFTLPVYSYPNRVKPLRPSFMPD
jgi:hypothetical protein